MWAVYDNEMGSWHENSSLQRNSELFFTVPKVSWPAGVGIAEYTWWGQTQDKLRTSSILSDSWRLHPLNWSLTSSDSCRGASKIRVGFSVLLLPVIWDSSTLQNGQGEFPGSERRRLTPGLPLFVLIFGGRLTRIVCSWRSMGPI